MTSINIDHKRGVISTNVDGVIQIAEKGAIKLGTGEYLDELGNLQQIEVKEEYVGAIRYNPEKNCLQVCDGLTWKDINGEYTKTSNILWSLLF